MADSAREPVRPVRSTAWASCSTPSPLAAASFLSFGPLILTVSSSSRVPQNRGLREIGRCLNHSLLGSRRRRRSAGLAALDAFLLVRVPAEGPRVGELAELVPDHVLRDEHVVELL